MRDKTYKLRDPITTRFRSPDGEREEILEEVTVRQPKARDLRAVDKHQGQVAQSLAMIAALTGLTNARVDELSVFDVGQLGEIVEGFMGPGLPTGATSSAI
jgi:hypothetical protein